MNKMCMIEKIFNIEYVFSTACMFIVLNKCWRGRAQHVDHYTEYACPYFLFKLYSLIVIR